MQYRIKNLWLIMLVLGAFLFSLGYNFHLLSQINSLEKSLQNRNWITDYDLLKVKEEITRLDTLSTKGYDNTGE